MQQPSLPLLIRILAAVDLELRITVDDYDSHDDVRMRAMLAVPGHNEQRGEHPRTGS